MSRFLWFTVYSTTSR